MRLGSGIKELGLRAGGKAIRIPAVGRFLARWADRGPVPKFQILVYHRVLPVFDPFVITMVPSDLFARQMRLLRECYRPVSLDTLIEELDGNRLRPGTVAVTFDDGYRDNHEHAWPILKAYQIPATVYVATGLTGTRKTSWYDQVLTALRDPGTGRFTFEPAGVRDADIADADRRARVAYGLMEWLKGFAPVERNAHVRDLLTALRLPPETGDRLMLDWEEIRAMRASGLIHFGAHTVNHPILAHLSEAEMESEIAGSQRALQDVLQEPVRHFAYPNGKPGDYTPATQAILKRLGFASAVTTSLGVNHPGSDRFQWARRQPWESDVDGFALRFAKERFARERQGV
jgi:peptidoglycan/xylan/chitin deacetylase (PgdA/CDA1 family)